MRPRLTRANVVGAVWASWELARVAVIVVAGELLERVRR